MAVVGGLVLPSLLVAFALAADGGGDGNKAPPGKSLSATGCKPPFATVKPMTVRKTPNTPLPKSSARSRLRAVAVAGRAVEYAAMIKSYISDPTKLLQIPVVARESS